MPDPETSALSAKIDKLKEFNLPAAVLSLDVSADGQRLYAASLDRAVYEVDAASGKAERLMEHDSYASGVRLLPKQQTLISAGYDGALQWFDLAGRRLVRRQVVHQFWSWKLAVSEDERLVASVTGQYLSGGYKYEPAAEREPSAKIFDAQTGKLRHQFTHTPPVLSCAFSPDSRFFAAGNMMGEVRIWDLTTGQLAAAWSTPDFTSWGIIKSHHYCGGIFAMTFSPDGAELFLAGMGPMKDPMAGNGKQTWQRYAWREVPPRKSGEVTDAERGNGLMEAITFHPSGRIFAMAGRLAQGKWNAAFFDAATGRLLESFDSKMRITDAAFSADGKQLFLGGAVGQEKKKEGKYAEFGRLKRYSCLVSA
jgi:WD40 repeat protein